MYTLFVEIECLAWFVCLDGSPHMCRVAGRRALRNFNSSSWLNFLCRLQVVYTCTRCPALCAVGTEASNLYHQWFIDSNSSDEMREKKRHLLGDMQDGCRRAKKDELTQLTVS